MVDSKVVNLYRVILRDNVDLNLALDLVCKCIRLHDRWRSGENYDFTISELLYLSNVWRSYHSIDS
jgi:hypothetical protein